VDYFELRATPFVQRIKKFSVCAGVFFNAVTLQAQTPPLAPDAASPSSSLALFGDRFASARPAPLSQARVFVYRTRSAGAAEPVNIYLDGRYHAALLKGGYTEFCSSPGKVTVHAVLNDAQYLHTGKTTPVQPWSFQAGRSLFLKVSEAPNAWGALVEMPAEQAQRELAETAEQIHTVSRAPLVQPCQNPATVVTTATALLMPAAEPLAPVKTIPPRLYALEADALFEFGKTEFKASSYNAIENMVQNLFHDYSKVERIRVVGHSDGIGPAKLNRKLSLERAQVVADQLKSRGVMPTRGFKVEGVGDEHLLKTSCGKKPTPENKVCHAPNRRVDIVVTGAKR